MKQKFNFNIILHGVGGQGIITLINVLDQAAFLQGFDVRSSELHGLSQREGSVEAHVRFGDKINSPMVAAGQADLIFSLEIMESLRGISQASKQTKFLVNNHLIPFQEGLKMEEILDKLKLVPQNNLHLIKASEICKEKLQNEVVSSIYLLGYGVYKGLIPLKPELVLKALEKVIPQKYLELNINALNLAKI